MPPETQIETATDDTNAATTEGSENTEVTEEKVTEALYGKGPEDQASQTESEEKTVEETKDELKADEEEKPKEGSKEEAPKDYELAKPEETLLSDEQIKNISEFAKENNLTKENAQKLLDSQSDVVGDYSSTIESNWWKQVDSWKEDLKADTTFGGDKYEETVEVSHRAFTKWVDADTVKMFNDRGYGNFPGLVKAFARIGAEMGDDKYIPGKQHGNGPESYADKFYGKS